MEENLSSMDSDFIDDDELESDSQSIIWRDHMPAKYISEEDHFHRFLKSLMAEILDWER